MSQLPEQRPVGKNPQGPFCGVGAGGFVPPPVRLGRPTKRGAPHPRCWKRPRFGFRVEKGFRASWGGARGNWGSLGGLLGELEGTGGSLWGGSAQSRGLSPHPAARLPHFRTPLTKGAHRGGSPSSSSAPVPPPPYGWRPQNTTGLPRKGKHFIFPPPRRKAGRRAGSPAPRRCRAEQQPPGWFSEPGDLWWPAPHKNTHPKTSSNPQLKPGPSPAPRRSFSRGGEGGRRLPPEPEAALWGGGARTWGGGKAAPKAAPTEPACL